MANIIFLNQLIFPLSHFEVPDSLHYESFCRKQLHLLFILYHFFMQRATKSPIASLFVLSAPLKVSKVCNSSAVFPCVISFHKALRTLVREKIREAKSHNTL